MPQPDSSCRLARQPAERRAEILHLVVTPAEPDIIVNALRSVGDPQLADGFEAVRHQLGRSSSQPRQRASRALAAITIANHDA
jgi:hypothetical protein